MRIHSEEKIRQTQGLLVQNSEQTASGEADVENDGELLKEISDAIAAFPNAGNTVLNVRFKNGKAVVEEVTTRKRLNVMKQIVGKKLPLREGETYDEKIFRLTALFPTLIDFAIKQKVAIELVQVSAEDIYTAQEKAGPETSFVTDDGEYYLWTIKENSSTDYLSPSKIARQKKRKREKPKRFEQYKQEESQQLKLLFDKDADRYSHTVELYDFMPKYVWGKSERIDGKFLEPQKREFECRGTKYTLVLSPVFLEVEPNEFKAFFPTKREELVEDALRKLASDGQGVMLDEQFGLTFSLYQLRNELKRNKHTYKDEELKASLRILAQTDLEVRSADGQTSLLFSPIETLGFKNENGETQTFVRFSPLVTQSIKQGTFRLINYEKTMSYRSSLARQLHKRMSHHYTQASLTDPYTIMLTTMIRDFGLTAYKQLRNNMLEVEKAIEELKDQNVVLNCKTEKIIETKPRVKIIDAKFSFQPHFEFVAEMRKANAKAKQIKEQIENRQV